MSKNIVLTALTLLFISSATLAQSSQRSEFEGRKKSIMDGNSLRATYHNFGHAGRTDNQNFDELLFEYPKNTGREYMYFMSVMIGTEVENQQNPEGPDIPIVNVANYRTASDGASWSMNPVTGYSREGSNEIARSDRGFESPLGNTWPNSWPDKLAEGGDGWAGSWNGYFGRDQFNADVEFYYRFGDDLYTRFIDSYQPDETDPTRGGLALIMDARILAWSQPLLSAVHFNIFEVTNDASYDYDQVAFGLWIADLVGGDGSDQPVFDELRSIAYLTDINRSTPREIFDGPVGEMGLKFLETPGNAQDGIDNDGDSNNYNPSEADYYDPDNVDLYSPLTIAGGGFYSSITLLDTVVREFELTDFEESILLPGDKIVLIQENGDRVIATYPSGNQTVVSQGRSIMLPETGFSALEDILDVPSTDPNFGIHYDGLDNDLDGLIDENTPNHLLKNTILNDGSSDQVPVRFINYLSFEVGDTLQTGLIVSNQVIRERILSDAEFEDLVMNFYEGRFQNLFTSAPMIDEARDDFFDNDNDWNATNDDVGIEGDPNTISVGQGDGKPSSGAGTNFPGESSIDKTDISETDNIGVTRATILAAGDLDVDFDGEIWNKYLIPGEFSNSGVAPGDDSDIYISSGLFPLKKGATERFAVAVTAAQEFGSAIQDRAKINSNLDQALGAYETDYQFARAPNPPIVSVATGNGYATIYWDNSSEDSFDRYLQRVTGNGFDFEGYKVYKATNASFEDARSITDGSGSALFYEPIAVFDRDNGISGYHPVPVNGTQYNLGTDSGLKYSFTDTEVENGKKYFYAVVGFDYGAEAAGIAPSESAIAISQQPDGSFVFGQNVIEVIPAPTKAGYVDPENPEATIVSGSPGGNVNVRIVDPTMLTVDKEYRVVFQDTLIEAVSVNNPDTVKTKNFSLIDITNPDPDTLIKYSELFNGEDLPIIDGFLLSVENITELGINTDLSNWGTNDGALIHAYEFTAANSRQKVSDYQIVFGDLGFGQSSDKTVERAPGDFRNYPSVPTNFKVFNTTDNVELEYGLFTSPRPLGEETPVGEFAAFSTSFGDRSDNIYIIEDFRDEEDITTYKVRMNILKNGSTVISENPNSGDTLSVVINKPFQGGDVFEFKIGTENVASIDNTQAKEDLNNTYVVPNPYVVSSPYEPSITNTDNTQKRALYFVGVPVPSTIRVFTVAGVLVETIEVIEGSSNIVGGENGGAYRWDLLSKDDLELSYGVYLYHIEAPGIGEKVGKFAVIK